MWWTQRLRPISCVRVKGRQKTTKKGWKGSCLLYWPDPLQIPHVRVRLGGGGAVSPFSGSSGIMEPPLPCRNVLQDRARTCKVLARSCKIKLARRKSCKFKIGRQKSYKKTISCSVSKCKKESCKKNAAMQDFVQTSCKKKILQEYSKILAYDVRAVINLARRELTKHVSCYW